MRGDAAVFKAPLHNPFPIVFPETKPFANKALDSFVQNRDFSGGISIKTSPKKILLNFWIHDFSEELFNSLACGRSLINKSSAAADNFLTIMNKAR